MHHVASLQTIWVPFYISTARNIFRWLMGNVGTILVQVHFSVYWWTLRWNIHTLSTARCVVDWLIMQVDLFVIVFSDFAPFLLICSVNDGYKYYCHRYIVLPHILYYQFSYWNWWNYGFWVQKILIYYLMFVLFWHLYLIVQYAQSGVLVLLLRLAQEMYLESSEEVLLAFDLLSRLVTFNMVISLFQILVVYISLGKV